jgi:hypothetical protein
MTQSVFIKDGQSASRSTRSLLCRSISASTSLSDDFSLQVVSGVRFAPLLRTPSKATIIPSKVWDPSIHSTYPTIFKHAIKEILLCSHAQPIQPRKVVVETEKVNLAASLPKDLWMKILSFTHRSWFDQPHKMDEAFLRQRIVQEQQAAREAKEACVDAERRLRLMERERDGYKLIAMRWQLRLRAVIKETKKSKVKASSNRVNRTSVDEDPLLSMDDLTQAAALFFRAETSGQLPDIGRRLSDVAYDSDATSDVDGEYAEGEEEDDGSDFEENDTTNMEAESDNDGSDNNEMVDADSEEDDSDDVTLAASPDTSDGLFFRQISVNNQSQSFFT